MILETFNKEISGLIDRGQNRPAIKFAKEVATHALATAAGIYSSQLADTDEALKLAKLSIEIQPLNPVLYSNVTCLLCSNDCYREALEYSKIGVTLPNANADMFFNHGIVCMYLNLLEEASKAFHKSLELNPDSAITHCHLANVLLPLGLYEEGLREDEWRFKALPSGRQWKNRYKKPFWDGKTDIRDKKILVFNEQGVGDVIQFSRYIPNLKALGAYVIFEVSSDVYNLYINAPYVDELIRYDKLNQNPEFPEHDFVISVASLPVHFDPNLDNIPMSVPYIYPIKTEIMPIINHSFKVGIIWAGSAFHKSDHERSCFLRYFEPLAKVPMVSLYSLQHGTMKRSWSQGPESILSQPSDRYDIVDLMDGLNFDYIDLAPNVKDFNDTAQYLQQLDLFITVDTSAAHLAGALGRPVWMLLPYSHEWRWRKTWYPTMKIFQQTRMGDWKNLLENVAKELEIYVKNLT